MTEHHIQVVKDAIRDGLRSVKLAIEDQALLPGAGAFEVAAACALRELAITIPGKEK